MQDYKSPPQPLAGPMSAIVENRSSFFRPERYPLLRPIVEGDDGAERSLADTAGDTLLAKIVSGELPAGARLKTTEIGAELGMSRTPVAKALAKLASEGILLQQNNHQAIVAAGAAEWLVQVHELRQLLEPEAALRAAGRVPQEVLEDLWLLSRDSKPTKAHDWVEPAQFFDFALHLSIAEHCGNLPIAVSIRRCWRYKRLSYQLSDGCRSTLMSEYDEHVAILAALAEGDANRAKDEMAKHLQRASSGRFSQRVV